MFCDIQVCQTHIINEPRC